MIARRHHESLRNGQHAPIPPSSPTIVIPNPPSVDPGLAWDELLDWAGTRAADEDARWLRVDVWTTNERLQHHYLKQGFTSIGIVVLPHNPSGALFQRPAQRVPTPRLVEDLRRGFSRLSQRNPEIDRPVTPLS
jgi:hypothetical protein